MTAHATTLKPLFTWRTAIMKSDLPPNARLVAYTLAMYMNEAGSSCFPSIALLVEGTGLYDDTVTKYLTTLCDEGFLRRTPHKGGPGRGTWVGYEATTPYESRGGQDPETTTTPVSNGDHPVFQPPTTPALVRGEELVSNSSRTSKHKTLAHPVDERVGDEALKAVKTFDDFWKQYPRKVSRFAAKKAWDRLSEKDKDIAFVGLLHWVDYWDAMKTAPQFIKHPSTWLNNREWNDVPSAAQTLVAVGPRIVPVGTDGDKRNLDTGSYWDAKRGIWQQDREWLATHR